MVAVGLSFFFSFSNLEELTVDFVVAPTVIVEGLVGSAMIGILSDGFAHCSRDFEVREH